MKYKNILITGASSGMGRELAIEYSKICENLFITGRDIERLSEVFEKCQKNCNVLYKSLDIRNKEETKEWIDYILNKYKTIDLVIANAGVSGGTSKGSEEEEQIYEIFETNINGVLNTIVPIIPSMKKNKNGQICLISSMASFRGMPSAPSYSSTKACIRIFGEALYNDLKKYNVSVTTICPGFIKTPLTDKNNFKMPFLMDVEKAVKKIINGIEKKKKIVIFPKIIYYIIKFIDFLPFGLNDFIFRLMPKK
jgi:short-subunit dehydrogenase